MPNLTLLAKCACTYSASQSDATIFIFVQVSDENGEPVKGLVTKDFTVWRGTQNEQISSAIPQSETEMPGIYYLTLKKTLGTIKCQAVYSVRIKKGTGNNAIKGWTLADLVKL